MKLMLVVKLNEIDGAHVNIYQQLKNMCQKYYYDTQIKDWSFHWHVSNYNYDQAGKAIGVNLLNNPDLVATDPVISFKTAIWFWMTPQGKKPSSHDVIIGKWTPSPADTAVGRKSGYGVITNIINGKKECGQGYNDNVFNRIGFYKRYSDMLGVDYGSNLDCYKQKSFA